MKKFLPWIIVGGFALWVIVGLRPPQDKPGQLAIQEFGKLPLVAGGRFQPLDSFARNSLLQLRGKASANLEPWSDNPKMLSATEWLLDTAIKPAVADDYPVFRVDHPELKSLLALPEKEQGKCDGKHYSWNQIKPKLAELRREADRASAVESAHRSPFDQAVIKLWNARRVYAQVEAIFGPAAAGDLDQSLADYAKRIEDGRAAYKAMNAGQTYDAAALEWVSAQYEAPVILPGQKTDDWQRVAEWLTDSTHNDTLNYGLTDYTRMSKAYLAGDLNGFNQAVVDYRTELAGQFGTQHIKAAREHYFNAAQFFYKSMVMYILAFLLGCGFWFNLSEWMRKTAGWLIVVAFIVHTAGLIFRMWLEGRPPVTNLYSSAIFIGWGAVVLGMVLEHFWKNAVGLVIASAIGFITLVIAHNLALNGDTMEMMRAVLDTNFWLATHVVVVTLGYASTFVAGFLAMIYIILGVFTMRLSTRLDPQGAGAMGAAVGLAAGGALGAAAGAVAMKKSAQLGDDFGKSLARMVYAIVCFATLFSFVGTVLGGIWADQSWGRFWGWDPKENGALLIVLWNALTLHARWGGLIRDRGLMNMAIFGNIVTAFSWFGVNMLGIGLHSYGFMDAAFKWLMLFDASQVALIVLGLLPVTMWKSFARTPKSAV